jgi:hypothetical protein
LVHYLKDLVISELSATARLVVTKIPKLQTNSSVHDQNTSSTKKKGCCAKYPVGTHATVGIYPACAFARSKVIPGTGMREERCRVEKISKEGGREKRWAKAGSGLANVILVKLRKARAEVKDGGHPGKNLSSDLGSRGMGNSCGMDRSCMG